MLGWPFIIGVLVGWLVLPLVLKMFTGGTKVA